MLNNTKTQSRPELLFLVPAIIQTHKSLENSQDFFVKTKTNTKTLFFVVEAPRDHDFGLEDYIMRRPNARFWHLCIRVQAYSYRL